MRNPVPGTELVEQTLPLDTEQRFQTVGGIVDTSVKDTAVVGACLHPGARMALDETDRQTREADFRSAREPDDTSADNENVYFFHRKIIEFYGVLQGSTGFYGVLLWFGSAEPRPEPVEPAEPSRTLLEPSRTRRTWIR